MRGAERPSAVIRVVIVDAEPRFRRLVRDVLEIEEQIEVVGEADDLRHALFEVRTQKPDVVLMGAEGIPEVLRDAPEAKVVSFSPQEDLSSARQAFAAGAASYVPRHAMNAEVVAAIREALDGISYVPPASSAAMLAAEVEQRRRAATDPLSAREREILRLVALGFTNREIAARLYISVRTAAMNRSQVMRKLGVRTRAELVRHAMRRGLLNTSEGTVQTTPDPESGTPGQRTRG
jgi:two-component system response regulator NreC